MTRELTDPDNDDLLEWSERVTDFDGDSLSVSLELDAIDDGSGWTQQDTDSSNLGWLSFTTTKDTLPDGTREAVVDVQADKTQLSAGSSYRFEVVADDGVNTETRKFVLIIKKTGVDGNVFYTGGGDDQGNNSLVEYSLSTSWDLTSASQSNQVTFSEPVNGHTDVALSPNGKRLYIADGDTSVHQYELSTIGDISTAAHVRSVNFGGIGNIGNVEALEIDSEGENLYLNGNTTYHIEWFTLSNSWNISSYTYQGNYRSQGGNPRGLHIKPDGTKIFENDDYDDRLYVYSLSTAFDVTGSVTETEANLSGVSDPHAIYIRPNGEEMWVQGQYSDVIKYSFSTAWDETTISNENDTNLSGNVEGHYFGK